MASSRQTMQPAYIEGGHTTRTTPAAVGTAVRYAGALALLAMAAVHLDQYLGAGYSKIPTIGTLFLLNFVGGVALALGLLSPLERLAGRRGGLVHTLLAAAGTGMAATSIAFLLVSESTQLFGFRESGYRPAIVVALVAEAAALVCLAAFVLWRGLGRR